MFTFSIEPLAKLIRKHASITGIKLGETEHRITLYAENVYGVNLWNGLSGGATHSRREPLQDSILKYYIWEVSG